MRLHRLAIAFAALSFTALANAAPMAYVSVSYTSSPAGAVVERDGIVLGRTPMIRVVKAPLEAAGPGRVFAPGCLDSAAVTFKWVSGARTTVSDPCQTATVDATRLQKVRGSKGQYTASVVVNASRPAEAPGLKRDERTERALGLQRTAMFSPGVARSDAWRGARSRAESYNTVHPGMGQMQPYF